MNISESLQLLNTTKSSIASAIEDNDVVVGDIPFYEYSEKIRMIAVPKWTRPADWIEMPEILENEQKFAGLFAVFPIGDNLCALTVSGNYTVDWGDGVIQNYTSGETASHAYDSNSPNFYDTMCSRGFYQAMVIVTPQTGNTITSFNLNVRHPLNSSTYLAPWLDLKISLDFCTFITISASTRYVMMSFIERVHLQAASRLESISSMFSNCYALKSVDLSGISSNSLTNMSLAFANCFSLQTVDLSVVADTSNVTNMSNMFSNCYALKSVNLSSLDTSNVTNMSSMFSFCYALKSVDLSGLNMGNVTSIATMFYNCYSLESIDMTYLDTSNVTNMSNLFSGCYALKSVDLSGLNMGNVTNMYNMFNNCYSLESIDMSYLDTSNVTNMSSMFNNCYSLKNVNMDEIETILVTSTASMFYNCYSLSSLIFPCKVSFSVINCSLSSTALDALYTSLPTVTPSKQITVTGNYGISGDNPSIATAKGWTVT